MLYTRSKATPEVDESILQFAWQNRTFKSLTFTSVSGKEVRVLKSGDHNRDAGPDFFNARIELDGLVLAGNIEIHVKSSDWLRHGHEKDPAYDNLILHVVYEHDVEIPQNTKHRVETIELKTLLPDELLYSYENIRKNPAKVACSKQLDKVDELRFSMWLQRMGIERLESKMEYIEQLANGCKNDPTQVFVSLLFRSFGFKVNALPFELLSKHLPVQVILRHASDLLQTEALLFGTSGFLQQGFQDKYLQRLQNESEHLIHKYQLIPLRTELFKMSRMRPANFPTVRLAQLASFLHRSISLVLQPQDHSVQEFKKELMVKPGEYWQKHYSPGDEGRARGNELGESAAESVIINAVAPYLFYYGRKYAKPDLEEKALQMLGNCRPEINAKTRAFGPKASRIENASDSQALIHLHDQYCLRKRCLECAVAAEILRSAAI